MRPPVLLAFTLVELIVVITILAILGTIGFVSLQGYSVNARDSVRISDTKTFLKALNIYQTKNGEVPLPDDITTITGSGAVFSYQGTLSGGVITELGQGQVPVDPLLKTPYLYATNEGRTKVQLLSYHEKNTSSLEIQSMLIYAETTYADMFPKVIGDELGILVNEDKSPIQEDIIELYNQSVPLMVIFGNQDTAIYSGYTLYAFISAKSLPLSDIQCPEGFILIPGNREFNTNDFCVAQYEMSYSDADVPDSKGGGGGGYLHNTITFVPDKEVVSMPGKYPIVLINEDEAKSVCMDLGDGFHLITNNEWMTIARNIEMNQGSWSTGVIGSGFIYNGVSGRGPFGCDREGGNDDPRTYATKTGPGNQNCNYKRSHQIFGTEEYVWDIAGNVKELVDKGTDLADWGFDNYHTTISGSSDGIKMDDDGKYDFLQMRRMGSALGLGHNAGMGDLRGAAGVEDNIFIRGGDSTYHPVSNHYAGIYSLILGRNKSWKDASLGFRCAYTN